MSSLQFNCTDGYNLSFVGSSRAKKPATRPSRICNSNTNFNLLRPFGSGFVLFATSLFVVSAEHEDLLFDVFTFFYSTVLRLFPDFLSPILTFSQANPRNFNVITEPTYQPSLEKQMMKVVAWVMSDSQHFFITFRKYSYICLLNCSLRNSLILNFIFYDFDIFCETKKSYAY